MATAATDFDATWNGKTQSYRPGPGWKGRIAPRLMLHDDALDAIDPVDFEVIRQKLWTINIAHGDTITRISGSPVLATLDFNMSILTEDAEVVLNAPYVQFLNAGAPLGIRYIMEHHGDRPGIDEGDVYCCNDPWIAACHQMDVLFAAPVFVDGRLFAWVANAGHQYDLGGIVPGGWPQNAADVYSDPVVLPPFKLIEKGEMRRDLEAVYLRQSRLPDMVALDLRAQIAGVVFARDQVADLCTRFGAATVKAAMRQMLDQAQDNFRRKLALIPDGVWTETRYVDEPLPGIRTAQRTQLTITKRGDRLRIENAGTDAQTLGTNAIPFVTWTGCITGIISISMLYEQLFAYGGSERHIDYDPTPGTLTCVSYPGAVSGGILHSVTMMNAVQAILSRMMACDPGLKEDLVAPTADFALPVLVGFDDRDRFFGQALLDSFACGSGARSFGDGIDTSGPTYSPLSMILNVEQLEQWYPLVYLYRKDDADSGGAGRWRGGNGLRSAVTPYRARSMSIVTNTGGQGATTQNGQGLFGGLPSPAGHYRVRRGTDLSAWFGRRTVPGDIAELDADETITLSGKSNGTDLAAGDVFEIRVGGGGGYGDPIERDPAMVARDAAVGAIWGSAMADVYGVILADDGGVDAAATEAKRDAIRERRAAWPPSPRDAASQPVQATGEPARMVHEYVRAADRDGQRVLECAVCGTRLSGYADSFKTGTLYVEEPVTALPSAADPARFVDDAMVLRRFCCPGCKTQIATEIARADEPIFPELRLIAWSGSMTDARPATLDRLIAAERRALALLDAIEAAGIIAGGRTELEVERDIFTIAARDFGVTEHWHDRIVRAGANTLCVAGEAAPDRVIADDDIVFLDLGPVFGAWEADVGRSYAIGGHPAKHALCAALPEVFDALKARFDAQPDITGEALYAAAHAEADRRGWRFGGRIAGHLVGEYPYARNPHDKELRRIAPGNTMRMRDPDPDGRPRHWIIEVHLVSPDGGFGGFYERLLEG